MQIEIKIDEKCKEPKIIVMTDKMTDEVNAIIKRLSDEQPQVIAGFREDVVEVLEPSEIYRVFAESGSVCRDKSRRVCAPSEAIRGRTTA